MADIDFSKYGLNKVAQPEKYGLRPVVSSLSQQQQPDNRTLLQKAGDFAEQNINQPIEQNVVNPAMSAASGAVQGIANIFPGAYNLAATGVNALGGNLPKSQMIDLAPHNGAANIGNIASMFAGPGAIKLVGKTPEISSIISNAMRIPMVAHAIGQASNVLSKYPITSTVAGNALLGGAYSPDHPILGMAAGVASIPAYNVGKNILTKGIDSTKNSLMENPTINKFVNKFMPEKYASDLTNELKQGASNFDKNSASLATDIRNGHDMRNEEAGIFLNHALDRAGNEEIYKNPNPLISTEPDEFKNISERVKDLKIGDLYDSFKNNPSFKNAHNLQSELGVMIGDLEKNPHKTIEEAAQIGKVKSIRDQLKGDIADFLENRDSNSNESLAPTYKRGIDLYKENVVPYLSNKKLRDITRGRQTLVKNIHSIFDTPSNIENKATGAINTGPINKLIQDLPEESKGKIIYSAIGGDKKDASSLLDSLVKTKGKGFSSYFTPELDEKINELQKKISNKKIASTSGKIGAGVVGLGAASSAANSLLHAI